MNPAVAFRRIRPEDAAAAAQLCGELGYPISADEMAARIGALAALPDHVVYLACLEDEVVGWIHVAVVHHFHAPPRAEIGGLVVSSSVRSRGIGRALVAQAERWAAAQGMAGMLVRSEISRARAHEFYLRDGYRRTKTSAVFTKPL